MVIPLLSVEPFTKSQKHKQNRQFRYWVTLLRASAARGRLDPEEAFAAGLAAFDAWLAPSAGGDRAA